MGAQALGEWVLLRLCLLSKHKTLELLELRSCSRVAKEEEPDVDSGDEDPCGPYLDDQGLLPNGSYMCLDGVARTGNWEEAKRRDPTDLTWLTEWVVAARTGQLEKK
ncbi:unnamed protein product [Cladocopium goreaui]|uniref:Uncharacterized protein n=1 Tax=Cladocopium goreaui TaxID=2562237 RepID=A0A9P1BIG4_9DINO|nr:unnamed protein product [Cladocopium goreaui]